MTWREALRPRIAATITANATKPEKELRAALRAAFPAGPHAHHPYKIWLDEISRQLGHKPPLGSKRRPYQRNASRPQDGRQSEMFT